MAQPQHTPYDLPQPGSLAEGVARLTPREREVLGYLADGKPNKVIAIELGISQRTAEAHRARVFAKLAVRNAVELVRLMCGPPIRLAEPDVQCAATESGQGELPLGEVPPCGDAGACAPGRGTDYLQAGAG